LLVIFIVVSRRTDSLTSSLRPYLPNNLFTSCCLIVCIYSVLAGTRSTVPQVQQLFHAASTATSPMLLDILPQTWTYFSTSTCVTCLAYLTFIYCRWNNSVRKVTFKGWTTGSDWHRGGAIFVNTTLCRSVLEHLGRGQGAKTVAQQYSVSWRVRYETLPLSPRLPSRWVINCKGDVSFALMQRIFPAT
jgi:hypothetical protein